MRQAAKLDAIQPDIETAFLGMGCSFLSLAMLGRGRPDALVGVPTDTGLCLNLLIEIKSHKAGTVAGEPNEEQAKWAENWRGQKPVVIRSVVDAGLLVKNVRVWAATMREELSQSAVESSRLVGVAPPGAGS